LNAHKGYGSDVLLDFTVACPNCHSDNHLELIHTKEGEKTIHTYLCKKCDNMGIEIKLIVKSFKKKGKQ